MSKYDNQLPGGVFWRSADGRVEIIRHYEGLYELVCEGVAVMPPCGFDLCASYVWAEFPPW